MKKLTYLSHIDSLRGIAVLLVILFHLDIGLFKGGFIGVDVFFVISGFLITRIINFEYSETGAVSLKRFYLRRIRRLMPTLFLILFLTFIFTFLIFSPSDFMNAIKSMFASSVALSNFYFLGEADYFDTSSAFKPLLHTWSLGIEEQFYLLFPATLLLLLKLFKNKKNGVTICLFFLFSLSLLLTLYTSKFGVPDYISNLFMPKDEITANVNSLQFYLLPFRMFEFLTGALLALISTKAKFKSEFSKLALNLLGIGAILCSAIFLSKDISYLSTLNLIPCLGAGVLLFFPPSKYLSFIFDSKPLKYIGKISYTLYLIHWPLIVFYRYLFDGELSGLEQIYLFVIMVLLSAIIYRFYETPLRYTNSKFSIKSNKVVVASLVGLIFIAFGISNKINKEEGWLWRLSQENLDLIEKIGVPKDYHENNWGGAGYKRGWVGKKPEKNKSPDIILMGDSHAGHYLYGLDLVMTKKNNKSVYISNWFSSLKLPDIIRNNDKKLISVSKSQFRKDLATIKKYPKSTVVLSQSWMSQLNRSEIFNDVTQEYEKFPKNDSAFLLIVKKIEKLHIQIGTNRKLIVIGASPKTNSKELNYVEKLLRPKYLSHLAPTVTTFEQNMMEVNAYFEKYFKTSTRINFIDPSPAFCINGNCFKQLNNKIYFSDSGHLSKDGSVRAVEFFENRLLKILTANE